MNHAQSVAVAAGVAAVAAVVAAAGLMSVSYRWPGAYRAAGRRALNWLRMCGRPIRRIPRPRRVFCRAHEKAFPGRGRHHAGRASRNPASPPETTGASR